MTPPGSHAVQLPVVPSTASPRPFDRFGARVGALRGEGLHTDVITTLQVNVGKVCNQACRHCHVDAGPARTESMDDATVEDCLTAFTRHPGLTVLDITGGAPELHPMFRHLVARARALGVTVQVRHNLTVMHVAGYEDLPEFFAAHGVEVFSSLPHYTRDATDRQRGAGVFDGSIRAMRRLNAVGYGTGRADRPFTLVYNPGGAFLPGSQGDIAKDFRDALGSQHGVTFDRLVALTNMPIERFRAWLLRAGQLEAYQARLETAFNPATLAGLMCRSMVSVGWDGHLYDCDFNQMLNLPVNTPATRLRDLPPGPLARRAIVTGNHCFGCTAGAGSSCGGALT